MLNKINEINLEDNIIYDNLFPLFKSNNPYIDNEFHLRIEKYKTYKDFFTNYSHFSITFLDNFLTEANGKINIFTELLTKNEFAKKNENDMYYTIISNIILMNFLYLRLNTYINNIYVQLRDFIHIILYQSKNNDVHYKLNEYLQLINQSPDFFHRKDKMTLTRSSTKDDTASFRPQEFMNIITQKITPDIKIELNETPKNSNNDYDKTNVIQIDTFGKSDVDTPCFHKEQKRYNSPEQKRPKSRFTSVFSPKRKNTSDSIPNATQNNSSKSIVSFTSLINDNNNEINIKISKDKPLVSLLAICSEMFKKNIISFEEKCQLKKLIIDKDKTIFSIFEKSSEKEYLYEEIKNYLKKFV